MNDDDYAYRFQYADGSAFQIYADGTAYIMAKDGSIRDKPKGLVTNRIPMLVGSVAKPRQDRIDVLEEALHDLYNAVRNEEVEKVVMRQAASALDGVPAQRALPQTPTNLRQSMLDAAKDQARSAAPAQGAPDHDRIALDAAHKIEALPSDLRQVQRTARIQCIVLDALSAVTSTPSQAIEKTEGGAS